MSAVLPFLPPRTPTSSPNAENAGTPLAMDESTLASAFGVHREAAHRLAQQIVRDSSLADDAVQDAFVKLWKGNAQFDPSRGTMRGLVLTIARHSAIDLIRRQTRRARTEGQYCTDATYVTDGPEQQTERADEALRVRAAVSGLPASQRSTVEMAYFSGLTRREIAVADGVPLGTVKSRMRLGMKKLAEVLREERAGWVPAVA